MHSNSNDIVNSDIWRIGPKQFSNQVYLDKNTGGIISKNTHLFEMTGTMKTDKQLPDYNLTKQDINCYTTTDKQEYIEYQDQMHRQNIGVMKLVNAGLCDLFPTTELGYSPVKLLPEMYLEYLDKSSSIPVLLKKIVHSVIIPMIWAQRIRSEKSIANPKNNMATPKLVQKLQFAWLFILLNSQNVFPPRKK